jgi:glutamate-ammonia-ligase adenylyltransferase
MTSPRPAAPASGHAAWFGFEPEPLEPLDREEAQRFLADLAKTAKERELACLREALSSDKRMAAFLGAALTLSPYLGAAVLRRPEMLEPLGQTTIDRRLQAINEQLAGLASGADPSEADLMAGMRRLKTEAHVLIGIADLAAANEGPQTVARLSDLAETCVRTAIRFLLLDAGRNGRLSLPEGGEPEAGSGLIIIGMGKLGARELNFSSDIDLVVFFDPQAPALSGMTEAGELLARLTRRLVRILQERTEHGYVFRTDLRLRPDPGSTPLALSTEAALHYYEGRGQNWERAALIKARQIAGDEKAGSRLLKELQPFIWRKYMDYAAIADVHSIKRQIHAHKGHGEIAVRGHNVKLGRGGIREVEFFVQTQQLIAGGRFPELRARETVRALAALAGQGWITAEVRAAMEAQYWFLRNVEHAIQIVRDEQTHILPDEDEELERIARMLRFADAEEFAEAFRQALRTVEKHYAALFETAPQLSAGVGNLVFTGDVDDPDTLQTLSNLGFERPSDICRIIRTWHFGRYRATQSAEARERLTELTPALLKAFGETRRADEALIRFDDFLKGLPAGIQLFSLLQSNPSLLKLLVTIMGAAPRLAGIITRRPHVFDGLLDPSLLAELPNKAYLAERLETFLRGAGLHEERLDRLRIFAAEQKFLIGMRLLTGTIDHVRAGKAFSDLADLTIAMALEAVREDFARRHGEIPGGQVAVLGMGKLGSRELTAGSDIDLILIYDHEPAAEYSDGEKPLDATTYFTRLTQRLIAAVSAPTAEGVLYELDLRLRPSGNKGPVATHVKAFAKYQRNDAWTWEHMALTRARTVAGDEELRIRAEAEIADIFSMPRDARKVLRDAAEMRALIAREKPPRDIWDVKLIPGGLIDLEFVAQTAVLTGHVDMEGRLTATAEILARLSPDIISLQARDELVAAHALYSIITQITRLCLTGPLERESIPPGLADALLAGTGLPDLGVLEAHLQETSRTVAEHCDRLLRGKPWQDDGNVRPQASRHGG